MDASPGSLVFEGPVQCLAQPRAGDWRLRGRLRSADAGEPSAPAELLLSGVRAAASAQPLPARLHELRVDAVAAADSDSNGTGMTLSPGRHGYGLQLQAREGSFSVEVEALRLHYDVSQSFYHALPRTALPPLTRAGWSALLMLLRLPLAARFLNQRFLNRETTT